MGKGWRKRGCAVRRKVVSLQLKTASTIMSTILIVLAIAVGVLALMMAGLGIKMLLHKQKEFKRPCANADPKTGRCAHCTCGKKN